MLLLWAPELAQEHLLALDALLRALVQCEMDDRSNSERDLGSDFTVLLVWLKKWCGNIT